MRRNRVFGGGRGLIGMESEDQVVEQTPQEGEVREVEAPAADSVETDIIEIIEENTAAAELDREIEDAGETLVAVEQYIDALKLGIEEGGFSRASAGAVKVLAAHAFKTVGYTQSDMLFPSLESFGGTGQKLASTQLALEEAQGKFKKIWATIMEYIKKAIAWIQDKFFQIFGSAEKLQKRAAAIYERAADLTNGTPASTTIENEKLVKALFLGSAVPSTGQALVKPVADVANIVFNAISTASDEAVETLVNVLTTAKSEDDFKTPVSKFTGFPEIKDSAEVGMPVTAEGLGLYRSAQLPGGKAVFVRLPKTAMTGTKAGEAMRNVGGSVAAFSKQTATGPATKTLATLTPKEVQALATGIENLAGDIIKRRAAAQQLKEKGKKLTDAATSASNEAEKDEPAVARIKSQFATGAVKAFGHPAEDFIRYAVVEFMKPALDYAELSLKQYTSKAKTKEEPAADDKTK